MKKRLLAILITAVLVFGVMSADVTAEEVHINTMEGVHQMLLAEVSSDSTSYAVVSAYEEAADGSWTLVKQTSSARVGSKGVAPIASRRQGTSKTPEGILKLTGAFGQTEDPGTLFPYTRITTNMYWNLNSGTATYNQLVYTDPGGDREQLIKYKTYRYMFTTDYNQEQLADKGGAIFLHCNGAGATSGCVSVPEDFMLWCMTWLDPEKEPALVITTTADKANYLTPAASTVEVDYSADGNMVHWTTEDVVAQYEIQRAQAAAGPYTTVYTSNGTDNSWLDPDGGRDAYYRVVTRTVLSDSTSYSAVSAWTTPFTPFTDVPDGMYYTAPVRWAATHGITFGTGDTTFSPADPCTRGQVVTFLYRAAGAPTVTDSTNPFSDVTPDDYFYEAVLWGYQNGIVRGTSDTTFSPEDTATRAQFITFLHRFAAEPAVTDRTSPFQDLPSDEYYTDAVLWGYQNGIVYGTGEERFSPNDTCTRAQVVTFLYRYMAEN